MNQIKIGRFIAECRKKENLTQMQLAEKLNITDKAVSKWERGIAMPDASLLLDLCSILGISVNEFYIGNKLVKKANAGDVINIKVNSDVSVGDNVVITLDKNISSSNQVESFLDKEIYKRPIMPAGWHVLEVKFDEFLPDYIKSTLQLDSLRQTAFSKFYLCRKYNV